MEDADFSDEFCNFIRAALPTVDAAELLLALAAEPARGLTAAEAGALFKPAIAEARVLKWLQNFQARGLAAAEGGAWRYQPAGEELARHVETLRQAYNQRPVTLVRLIYALRDARMRTFADAFKLRKD